MSGYPRNDRVLLMRLSVRTSGKGNAYLSGWLGKARVVCFAGEPDQHGNECWDVFVSEPGPSPHAAGEPPAAARARLAAHAAEPLPDPNGPVRREGIKARQERTGRAMAERCGVGEDVDLDDPIPF